MRLYPQTTANKNVPAKSFLLVETSQMSGEIITTYYAKSDGTLWKVRDWKSDRPEPVFIYEICRLTGDTVYILTGRVESFFRGGGTE